eukprot:CAMPEP_0170263632 /NCGR_PEP_ID=MMETSP0116_2-20130129/31704_1 /TAXON_ID=400756 /ORGANISM="Durinskia baltica, Strain CSIRO CS-38" /LENGTH=271 /DNA_ID=CAMNT_0010514711 /DNA_START=245 /DNA_END=1059 /DNA_ORIENTATION=-
MLGRSLGSGANIASTKAVASLDTVGGKHFMMPKRGWRRGSFPLASIAVHRATEGVDVALRVIRPLLHEDLRRQETRGAEALVEACRIGLSIFRPDAGMGEVDDLDLVVASAGVGEHGVARANVPVHDALLMEEGEPLGERARGLLGPGLVERLVRLDSVLQRLAAEALGDEVVKVLVGGGRGGLRLEALLDGLAAWAFEEAHHVDDVRVDGAAPDHLLEGALLVLDGLCDFRRREAAATGERRGHDLDGDIAIRGLVASGVDGATRTDAQG